MKLIPYRHQASPHIWIHCFYGWFLWRPARERSAHTWSDWRTAHGHTWSKHKSLRRKDEKNDHMGKKLCKASPLHHLFHVITYLLPCHIWGKHYLRFANMWRDALVASKMKRFSLLETHNLNPLDSPHPSHPPTAPTAPSSVPHSVQNPPANV